MPQSGTDTFGYRIHDNFKLTRPGSYALLGGDTSHQAEHQPAAENASSSYARTLSHSHGCPYCDVKRKIGTCDGWKRHMKEHETLYRCRHCDGTYTRKATLVQHLQKVHNIHNGGHLAEEWRVEFGRKYFGCGFCVSLFHCLSHQLNHIDVEHFRQFKDIDEWDINNVVRGLIQQPGIQLAWEKIPQGPTFAPQNLIWAPSVANELQWKLSSSKESAEELAEEVKSQATWAPSPPGHDENGSAAALSRENLETHRTLQDIQENLSIESATLLPPKTSTALLKPSDDRMSGTSSDSSSDVGSILSVVDSVASSMTSVASYNLKNFATEEFINLLLQNAELNILYKAALAHPRVGPERFERNFRRILNRYSVDLKIESRGRDQSIAYKFVRHRSSYVANVLRRKFEGQIEDDHRHQVVEDKSPSHLVEEESASEDDISDDDYGESTNAEKLPELSSVKDFMITSEAFLTLRANFWQLVDPSLKLKLNGLAAELEKVPPDRITVSYQSDVDQPSEMPANGEANYLGSISIRVLLYAQNPFTGIMARFDLGGSEVGPFMKSMWKSIDSLSDRFKAIIEDFTNCPWDWWPLKPRTRGIQTGYARICWRCSCDEECTEDVPICFAEKVTRTLSRSCQSAPRQHAVEGPPQSETTSRGSSTSSSSKPTAQQGGHKMAQITKRDSTHNRTEAAGYNTAMKNVSLPLRSLFVLLGVAVGDGNQLAQIEISNCKDDDFFQQLRMSYNTTKGFLRRVFGIWIYAHCDFFKFEKFDENDIAPRTVGVPPPENLEYQYNPKPVDNMPPISPHEFYRRYYSCRGRCAISRSLFHFLHRCRKPCRPSLDAVNRIPKRVRRLETEGDAREFFWGLNAVERISFLRVTVYHLITIVPSLIFWFLWLFYWGHSGDLQNASVPFLAALGLISLLWFSLFSVNNKQIVEHP